MEKRINKLFVRSPKNSSALKLVPTALTLPIRTGYLYNNDFLLMSKS